MKYKNYDLKRAISIGSDVCRIIKKLFYSDIPWGECFKAVSEKFSELKAKARKFYAHMNEMEVLIELSHYAEKDILDMLS